MNDEQQDYEQAMCEHQDFINEIEREFCSVCGQAFRDGDLIVRNRDAPESTTRHMRPWDCAVPVVAPDPDDLLL